MIPVATLGVLAVAYVLARPFLAARVWHLEILEYPVGALVVTILILLALRRPERAPRAPEWRRHEQVVRALADPEEARLVAPLETWARTGRDAEAAAAIIARAQGAPEKAREIQDVLSSAASERKRRALLSELSKSIGA